MCSKLTIEARENDFTIVTEVVLLLALNTFKTLMCDLFLTYNMHLLGLIFDYSKPAITYSN